MFRSKYCDPASCPVKRRSVYGLRALRTSREDTVSTIGQGHGQGQVQGQGKGQTINYSKNNIFLE